MRQYANGLPEERNRVVDFLLNESWPAQAVKSAYGAVTLPGDVYQGRVAPTSDEAIGRAADLAGLATLGAGAIPAEARTLRMGAGGKPELPMDEASRMARARELGYDDRPFYRGDGGEAATQKARTANPDEYPRGAHFTSDPNYNDKAHFGDNREFRLDLSRALVDERPVNAGLLGRVLASAKEHDPKFAADLAGMFDKDVEWMIGFGNARPGVEAIESGAALRAMIERSAAPEKILIDAGIDALVAGHEVRKLTGYGIRHKDAAFDPAKKDRKNIFLGLGGAAAGAMTLDELRRYHEEGGA